jgi:hypothetical protein
MEEESSRADGRGGSEIGRVLGGAVVLHCDRDVSRVASTADIIFAQSWSTTDIEACSVDELRGRQSSTEGGTPMPLTRAAIPAVQDTSRGIVRFVMRDGGKRVEVLVSNAALDDIDNVSTDECSYFHRFKEHRRSFEHIASQKYDKGYVELDGTVRIKGIDLPLVCSD